jgi:hypothetical protein
MKATKQVGWTRWGKYRGTYRDNWGIVSSRQTDKPFQLLLYADGMQSVTVVGLFTTYQEARSYADAQDATTTQEA